MASGAQDNDDEITGINVTPLVDVMLVLLIIFMVTANYIVHKSIAVNLPKAETGEDMQVSKNLAFAIDKQKNLYLDGKLISYKIVTEKIQTIRKNLADKTSLQALITADEMVPHGEVVKLIDAVRKNGIHNFAINVEGSQPTTEPSTQDEPSTP